MKLNLTSIDQICRDLPEVTSEKIVRGGALEKDGLFSQQIFGPIKSYHCACNRLTYHGRGKEGTRCPRCGVEITTSEERRRRFAKIKLPFKILNPIFYFIIVQSKPTYKTILRDMLSYNRSYYIDEDGIHKYPPPEDPETGETPEVEELIGLDGVLTVINWLIEKQDYRREFAYIRDNFDKITIENILVIPPDFRPIGRNENGIYDINDDINAIYRRMILNVNRFKEISHMVQETDDIYRMVFRNIQMEAIHLYDFIMEKMSKKKGLIRANILGKRLDFSGRAVISPDPTLNLDECRIPYFLLLEILKPQLAIYLVNRKICKRVNQAVKLVEECIEEKKTDLFELCQDFVKDKICILNRQPTLHRLSILGFKVKVHLGNTIQIHPMITVPYNADFDGDAMAIYFPITEQSYDDIQNKISTWNNLLSPTDTTVVPRANQDIVLGIYKATLDEGEIGEKKEFKGKTLSYGRYLFNRCLPDDYPVVDSVIDSKSLLMIMNDIVLKYPAQEAMKTFDKIKKLGFMLSTLEGYTLSIDDLYNEEYDRFAQELTGNLREDMARLSDDSTKEFLKEKQAGAVCDFIDSGARGSWDQLKQLVLSRGYVADMTNRIRPTLIRSSLLKGLSKKEFFDSCWGSRKGLLDTALSTGDSGYLTRQLIYSTVFIELHDSLVDCMTDRTMEIYVEDKKMAKTLLWRYYVDEDGQLKKITTRNYLSIIGKTIHLRSPIYCRSRKICHHCYGELNKILHSNQIGVLATQAIGERTTQLVLRTFHTSGVAKASQDNVEQQDDIITGISLVSKLFHSPSKQIKDITPEKFVLAIYNIFNPHKGIHMVHYEVIVSSMMWVGECPWRLYEGNAEPEWHSILKVPQNVGWLIGSAFSNLKFRLLKGLIYGKEEEETSLVELFKF